MRSPTVMRLEAARLSRALSLVETCVEDQDWLMQGGFSGVDCAVGWSVFIASRFVRLDDRPALAAYLARCRARPGFVASLPAPGGQTIGAVERFVGQPFARGNLEVFVGCSQPPHQSVPTVGVSAFVGCTFGHPKLVIGPPSI